MKKKFMLLCLTGLFGISAVTGCGESKDVNNDNNENGAEVTQSASETEEETEIYVFIAASLNNAMTEIQSMYQEEHPEVEIHLNADSSGTLQTQIEEGAECDLFFSAAQKQMTELEEGGYVVDGSVTDLLENKVVLIKPAGGETQVTGFEDITKAANLALAGEDVPVGQYAREIFTNLGILDDVMAMEINEGKNVTEVLAAVSEGSNEVGVVYATDMMSVKDSVEVVAEAPEGSLETPVLYPVGQIQNQEADDVQTQAAADFEAYLQTPEVMEIFESYGFTPYTSA